MYKTRITLALVVSFLAGCAHYSYPAQDARIRAAWEQNFSENNRILNEARNSNMPKDYKEKIDQYFAAILNDPDSRKLEFSKTPYGSLVCGTVNAKNRFGGYVGRMPFFVYFKNDQIALLIHHSVEEIQFHKQNSYTDRSRYYHVYKLFSDCGY